MSSIIGDLTLVFSSEQSHILDTIIQIVVPIIGAFVLYWLGMVAYFKQKEYEYVKIKYIDGCVETLASHYEHCLYILSNNWSRLLEVAKQYRDLGDHFDMKEIDKGFLPITDNVFNLGAQYRLQHLVNSDIFWKAGQLLLADVRSYNSTIVNDLRKGINILHLDHAEKEKKFSFCNLIEEKFKESNDGCNRHYVLLQCLYDIIREIERNRLTLKEVDEFSNNKIVEDSIKKLADEYKEIISNYSNS